MTTRHRRPEAMTSENPRYDAARAALAEAYAAEVA